MIIGKRQIRLFTLLILLFTVCTSALARSYPGWVQETGVSGVVPELQEMYRPTKMTKGSNEFSFSQAPVIYVAQDADRVGAEELGQDLENRFGIKVKIVDSLTDTKPDVVLVRTGTLYNKQFVAGSEVLNKESYRLLVSSGQIVIEGTDSRGVLYGVSSLRQMVGVDAHVEPVFIRDWPSMPWRVSYAGVFDPESIHKHIRRAARLKMNAVIFESSWQGRLNLWFSPTVENRNQAAQFIELCKKYHIEPIPLIQGMGWGYGVTDLDPMTAEGVWYEDEEVVLHKGQSVPLSKSNVVTTKSAPILVSSVNGEFYEEGLDYMVIPGKTVRPYDKENEPWKISMLQGSKIHDKELVLVSYNAVEPNIHQAYCPLEPRSYKIIDKAIDYVMMTYKPRYIHLGTDEVRQSKSCSRCLPSDKTGGQLILDELMYRYNRVRKHSPKAEVMIWYDQIRTTSLEHIGKVLPYINMLPKDLIIFPWIYRDGDLHTERIDTEISFELKHGFRVIGTSAGYSMDNILSWYDSLAKYQSNDEKVLGMTFSYWGGGGLQKSFLPAAASLMWSGNKLNRKLFDIYGGINTNIREYGLMLTFPWDEQISALSKWYNKQLEGGLSPAQISQKIDDVVLSSRFEFSKIYGPNRWKALMDAPMPEQQAGMVQKLSLLVHLMGRFLGLQQKAIAGVDNELRASYGEVIVALHQMGYITYAQEEKLMSGLKGGLPTSIQLFGSEIGKPPANLKIGSDELSQLEVATDVDSMLLGDNEFRVYYIGNSITQHGFNKETIADISWDHEAGMAASVEGKDYVHLLGTKISQRLKNKKLRVFIGPGSNPQNAVNGIGEAKIFKPNLVIVQLGENIKIDHLERDIRKEYSALLDSLQSLEPTPIIIVVGTWSPGDGLAYDGRAALIDTIKREESEARGIAFVSVEKYAVNSLYSGDGKSWQVRWHPNDLGHAGYAREIFNKLSQIYSFE